MKRIFITYGDSRYVDRVQVISNEAVGTGVFDEVKAYNADFPFPDAVRFYMDKFEKGGGFWLWKPLIIQDTLKNSEVGDVIVYADAGCTLLPHKDWERYFKKLERYDMVLFKLKGKIGSWCARKVITAVSRTLNPKWLKKRPVMAGVIIVKNSGHNLLIDEWADMATNHPTLFADNSIQQDRMENNQYRQHRHDQAVLNALYYTLPQEDRRRIKIEPERFEYELYGGQAIKATRMAPMIGREHKMKKKGLISSLFIRLFNT